MMTVVLGLHALGFFLLVALVAPHHYHLGGSGAFALGTGITAYTLGMRHAFDADHIAAIDSTTSKPMAEAKRPISVGFFFSLGHSTVVFGLALLFAIGVRALNGQVQSTGSALHNVASLVGTGVSGVFLYVIAALNAVILWGIIKVFVEMRTGRYSEQELEEVQVFDLGEELLSEWVPPDLVDYRGASGVRHGYRQPAEQPSLTTAAAVTDRGSLESDA